MERWVTAWAPSCERGHVRLIDSAAVRTTRQSSGMGTKPMRAQTAPEPWYIHVHVHVHAHVHVHVHAHVHAHVHVREKDVK